MRYVAENVRPDLNLVAAVLSTRISNPNLDEVKELHHELCYLNSTKDLKLIIDNSPFDFVHACVVLHFDLHSDVISHNGMGLILKRTKQKLISSSSTTSKCVELHGSKRHGFEFLQG